MLNIVIINNVLHSIHFIMNQNVVLGHSITTIKVYTRYTGDSAIARVGEKDMTKS